MDFIDLVTNFATQGKYFFLFIAYIIEGPIFGFLSAVIASTGQLNILIIALLLISGEIGADIVYYYLGKNSSESKLMRKLQKYEDKGLLSTVKETLIRHPVRTLVFAKSVAFIAVPTLLLIGRYKAMKIGKYTLWVSIVCLVKDFTVLFLGYGLGISLEAFLDGYDIYRIIAIILAILAVIYIVYKANEEKIEDFTIKTLQNIK